VSCKNLSLTVYNNEFVLDSARVGSQIINWIATNTIGNYCFVKKSYVPYHIVSFLLQHVLKMSSSSTNASGRCWHYSLTAGSITCIPQGSVGTVLRWGGQSYGHLHQVFLMSHVKNYYNRPLSHGAIKKWKWHVFTDDGVNSVMKLVVRQVCDKSK